jgi:hypothetical protein
VKKGSVLGHEEGRVEGGSKEGNEGALYYREKQILNLF